MARGFKIALVVAAAFGLTALVVLAARRDDSSSLPPTPTHAALSIVPRLDHVYLIVMENKGSGSIIGSSDAPYINQLIRQNGLATAYTAVDHPSQPNYIALWSGDPQGVRDDRVHRINATNVGDQLEATGKTWKVFAQNLPIADDSGGPTCYTGSKASGGPDGKGNYVRKHEPAISFVDVSNDTARCTAHISDFSHFDPATANLELVVPNLCNDMHDCSVQTGDSWLQRWLPSHILETPTWKSSNSAIFIVWDEGSSNQGGGGNVPTIVISKRTPAGFTSSTPHDHYSLLRTIEEAFGVGCLKNACSANTLGEFFR
jgi:hypothetical protein